MASRFVEANKEFIEETQVRTKTQNTKKSTDYCIKISNNGQRWGEKMSNLKATKYQRLMKLSIILPFTW